MSNRLENNKRPTYYNDYWAAAASAEGLPYGDWDKTVTKGRCKTLPEYINAIEYVAQKGWQLRRRETRVAGQGR